MLVADDATAATALLRDVPAVGVIARHELQQGTRYTKELKGVVDFILKRAVYILGLLPPHDPDPIQTLEQDGDWREVRGVQHSV